MKAPRAFCSVFLPVAALVLLPSCEKKRLLQAELQTQKQTVEDNRHLMLALDEEIRATERSNTAQKEVVVGKEKIAAAEKQLKDITTALAELQKKVAAAEQKNKAMADELAAYKKETAKPLSSSLAP